MLYLKFRKQIMDRASGVEEVLKCIKKNMWETKKVTCSLISILFASKGSQSKYLVYITRPTLNETVKIKISPNKFQYNALEI